MSCVCTRREAAAVYARMLKTYGDAKNLSEGKRLHALILQSDHHEDRLLHNLLIEMYGKCANSEAAKEVFDSLQEPNSFSWKILMAAYTRNGKLHEARIVFDKMPSRDAVAWNSMVAAYAKDANMKEAQTLFGKMPRKDLVTWNTIVTAYAENGNPDYARKAFEIMSNRDIISWNALIAAYVGYGDLLKATYFFDKMSNRDDISWSTMIFAYAHNGHVNEAARLFNQMDLNFAKHQIAQRHLLDATPAMRKNIVSCNIIISVYTQNGRMDAAKSIFYAMQDRDAVSWNIMISAYCDYQDLPQAKAMFDEMPERNLISWNSMIQVYATTKHVEAAEKLFYIMPEQDTVSATAMITTYGQTQNIQEARKIFDSMPHRDLIAWNAIISAYGQNGHVQKARHLFNMSPQTNVVSWNAIIQSYAQHGLSCYAIFLFRIMDQEGIQADAVSFITILGACSNLASISVGKIVHDSFLSTNLSRTDEAMGNALVNMYGKCSCVEEARRVFDEMPRKNAQSWNTIIVAYARSGHYQQLLKLFQLMLINGESPNRVTFVCVLSSCSHAGLMEEAWHNFTSMHVDHFIDPVHEHYSCMVDLLSRAGWLEAAQDAINFMPFLPTAAAWTALFSACSTQGEVIKATCL